jgi:hypothetical protein
MNARTDAPFARRHTPLRRLGRAAAALLAGTGLVLSAAQAQNAPNQDKPAQPAVKPPAPVLLVDKPALERILVDPKDQALKNALAMLPTRLRELPREVPGLEQVPMPVVDLLLQLVARPSRFAMTYSPDNPSKGGFGAGLVFSVGMDDQQSAGTMHGTINALMAMAGGGGGGGGGGMAGQIKPSQTYQGMSELTFPFGLLAWGPRKSDDAGWRYEVHFGSLENPDKPFDGWARNTDLVKGLDPILRARFDPAPLTPLVNMGIALAGGGPELNEVVTQLKDMGYIGEDAVRYSYYSGFTADRAVSVTIAQGAKKFAPKTGMLLDPLSPAELKAIPADAVSAGMLRYDWKAALTTAIDRITESDEDAAEQLAQVEAQMGLNLRNDVLPALGTTFGWYLAPSAGGRGLGSAVALIAIGNKAKFDALNARLAGTLNALGASPQVRGYVRGRQWTQDGLALNTLTFPGLPIPVELTYAVTDKWLVLGFTPQAALAAAAQAAGKGDAGITANTAFASMMPKDQSILSLTFIDTVKTMPDGYQYVSLAGSAIANLVRSPADAGREPGLIVPHFKALAEGAKATVKFSYVRGDDVVSESHADRSMLVNAAGTIGALAPAFPLIGALIGGLGAVAQEGRAAIPDFGATWRDVLPNDAPWSIPDSDEDSEQYDLAWAR